MGVDEFEGEADERDPEMPHLLLHLAGLERLHPALVVPDDLHPGPDLADNEDNGILVEGERIVREIIEEARAHGRRRHMRGRTRAEVKAAGEGTRSAGWSRDVRIVARPGTNAACSHGTATAERPGTHAAWSSDARLAARRPMSWRTSVGVMFDRPGVRRAPSSTPVTVTDRSGGAVRASVS